MVFSSLTFLNAFLPATLILALLAHWIGNARLSNPVLLAASLVFYMWGIGASFVVILLLSIVVNWLLGLWTHAIVSGPKVSDRKYAIAASVIVNIALLGYFKYANFFVAETAPLREALGFEPFIWTDIILPIGISFFTFQSMSYVFDVASGRARVMKNPLDFALYVALFPQLIAGPIVRFAIVSEQLRKRTIGTSDLGEGAIRFAHGLVKKVIIADSAGAVADAMFALEGDQLTTGAAWLGALAYTVQIYFDFSGYSDMAIGIGRMLGFGFPENFNRPYASLSITEFWRRWHMTLSGWFRDYVYIPLGGSKAGKLRTYVNLWTVFVLTGIWHGANWTFLVWGLYHGALLVMERLLGIRPAAEGAETSGNNIAAVVARRLLVLLLVLIGWVVFRAPDLNTALDFYQSMFTPAGMALPQLETALAKADIAFMLIGLAIAILPPARFRGPQAYTGALGAIPSFALLLLALPFAMTKIMGGTYSPFLYFQF